MIKLAKSDPHFWAPDQKVIDALCARIGKDAKVLEIGPGRRPFPLAKTFVDIRKFDIGPEYIACDTNLERLPFADKSFDFIYCRHVLEDMWNPFLLCSEVQRVGKAGYIETPSPIVEMCRGVDAEAPNWFGFSHHRFIIWPHAGTLHFIGKFSIIEYLDIPVAAELLQYLRSGPDGWNSRFSWTDKFAYKHLECPGDFLLPDDYPKMLTQAVEQWRASANEWRG